MSPTVSIVVPVYNTEKWLLICINSILNQTYKDFELILINDGSQDSSGDICNNIAVEDNRVKVFHVENGGVSKARNLGVKNSTGKYICFIDSDDWVSSDFLETLISKQNTYNVDWVISGYVSKYEKTNTERVYRIDESVSFSNLGAVFIELDLKGIFFTNCGKLYLRDIIIGNNIEFSQSYTMGEDFIFNQEYLFKVNSIAVVDCQNYFYRMAINSTSLINKYVPEYFEINVYLLEKRFEIIKMLNVQDIEYVNYLERKNNEIILSSILNLYKKDCTISTKRKIEQFKKLSVALPDFKTVSTDFIHMLVFFLLKTRFYYLLDLLLRFYYKIKL